MSEPELIIRSQPIDFELCALLGQKPADFILLCFDGVPLENFGTPYDTPRNRLDREALIERLNDRTENSLWPELWENWRSQICNQFRLADSTTAADYRPVVSYKISRVCPGYSEHLHAAIGLFETLAERIRFWSISEDEECHVAIISKTDRTFLRDGSRMSLAIAEAIRDLLRHYHKPFRAQL